MRHYDTDFDDFEDMDYVGIRAIRHMIDEDRRIGTRFSGRRHANRFGADPWDDDEWTGYDDYDDDDYSDYDADEFDSYSDLSAEMR